MIDRVDPLTEPAELGLAQTEALAGGVAGHHAQPLFGNLLPDFRLLHGAHAAAASPCSGAVGAHQAVHDQPVVLPQELAQEEAPDEAGGTGQQDFPKLVRRNRSGRRLPRHRRMDDAPQLGHVPLALRRQPADERRHRPVGGSRFGHAVLLRHPQRRRVAGSRTAKPRYRTGGAVPALSEEHGAGGKWSSGGLANGDGTRRTRRSAARGASPIWSASFSASASSSVFVPNTMASASDRQEAVVISSSALAWKPNSLCMNAPSSATEMEFRPKLESGSSGQPSSWPHSSATLAAIRAMTLSTVSRSSAPTSKAS